MQLGLTELPPSEGARAGSERADPSGPPDLHPLSLPESAPRPVGRHVRRSVSVGERAAGWCGDRLPEWLRGRVRLGPREMALVAVVAAIGLLFAGVSVARSSGDSAAATVPPTSATSSLVTPASGAPSAGAPAVPGGSGSSAAATGAPQVVVDVAGRVHRPGVVRLPTGSRVVDAIRRAGGARAGVDLSGLNLARVLTDGEQVLVGKKGPAPGSVAASAAAGSGAAAPNVDINSASQEQLESLPGIGPVTAQKILAWRTAHGAFTSVDELTEIDGIGDKTLAQLAPYVTL